MHEAVALSQEEALYALLDCGASLAECADDGSCKSVLHECVVHPDGMKKWGGGSRTRLKNHGNKPADPSGEHMVQLLLDHAVSPCVKDRSGKTALRLAVEAKRHAVAKVLLQEGADPQEVTV